MPTALAPWRHLPAARDREAAPEKAVPMAPRVPGGGQRGCTLLVQTLSVCRVPRSGRRNACCLCGDEHQESQNIMWLEGCSVHSLRSYPPSPYWVLWGKKTCPLPSINIPSCRSGQTCLPGPRGGRALISAVAMRSYLQRQAEQEQGACSSATVTLAGSQASSPQVSCQLPLEGFC